MGAGVTPRGVRNNNPGNIDRSRVPWLGEDRSSAALASEARFCVFRSPEFGFRAMARTLRTYQYKHGLNTVRQLINRWAPPNENNTDAYVHAVAQAVGVQPDQVLGLGAHAMVPLLRAIAHHEQGGDYWKDEIIADGVRLAGVV